jgi:putative ABC transport system substrate-binding protein
MKRRQFISLFGGAAAAWPLAARAQQPGPVKRVGVLMAEAEDDPQSRARVAALKQALSSLGWSSGRNLQLDYRYTEGNLERAKVASAELLALAPQVVIAAASTATRALQQANNSIPIVFVGISEPVAQGFVTSLARPGGNITGFTNLEWTFGAKWLGMLRDIAPAVSRVGVMFNPDTAPYATAFVKSVEAGGSKLGIGVSVVWVKKTDDLDTAMSPLAREGSGGLIIPPDIFTVTHRKRIVELAARYRLPAISPFRYFPEDGGLVSYGVDILDQFRLAAGYVDRILKGAKPAELPVQQPTKFELVINLKTAKTLGLDVPLHIQQLADEMIE